MYKARHLQQMLIESRFVVKGWSIQTAKSTDIATGEWKEGEIIYEVMFERLDPVPMSEVIKHPTAAELDDYSEYKRLRKAHREGKRKEPTAPTIKSDYQAVSKSSKPIQTSKLKMDPNATPKAVWNGSPSASRATTFKRPQFNEKPHFTLPLGSDIISPKNVAEINRFDLAASQHSSLATKPSEGTNPENSIQSSGRITGSTNSDIKEVAPWIDFDPGLTLPSSDNQPIVARRQIISQDLGVSSVAIEDSSESKQSTLHVAVHNLGGLGTGGRDYRKSIFVRSRSSRKPMSKLLDGARDRVIRPQPRNSISSASTSTAVPSRSTSMAFQQSGTGEQRNAANRERRNAIWSSKAVPEVFPKIPTNSHSDMTAALALMDDDEKPSIDTLIAPRFAAYLPLSLKSFTFQPTFTKPQSNATPPVASARAYTNEGGRQLSPELRSDSMADYEKGWDVKVVFKDPFRGPTQATMGLQRRLSSVAPDAVLC